MAPVGSCSQGGGKGKVDEMCSYGPYSFSGLVPMLEKRLNDVSFFDRLYCVVVQHFEG